MVGNAIPDIPRLYTAFAEWLACNMFALLLGVKIKKINFALLSVAYLLIVSIFMEATGTVSLWLWIPCMLFAFFLMSLYIKICNKFSFYRSIYYAVMAFSVAECIASIEWQVVNYFYKDIERMPLWFELLAIVLVYGGVIFTIWKLLKSRFSVDTRLVIEKKDWYIAVFICIIIFGFSNLSFITVSSTAQGQYFSEIAHTRTLVDIAGVSMLYAHLLSCKNNTVRRELDAVKNTLRNQYVQYMQSKENIEAINMKYHDMKHLINMLREINDDKQRVGFIDRIEADIKAYELQNKTGNSVLDTLLTSKSLQCGNHAITMTVVADGKLLDFMDAVDICSIFGNALDNAIEASLKIADKEKRLIHLTISQFKSFIMIQIENYFEGEINMVDNVFLTTKKSKQDHGYGIKSIKYTVERYGGVADIKVNNNWFGINILIPKKN